MLCKRMNFLMAFLALSTALLAVPTLGLQPFCGDPSVCHKDAYCILNATSNNSYCECQPGMIDLSDGDGENCAVNGWTVRYVVDIDVGVNPTATLTLAQGLLYCPTAGAAFPAEGYFLRSINAQTEVNCLYRTANKPANVSDYVSFASFVVQPAIYSWWLPTTAQPMRIPPTGLTVDSVHFKPNCSETGCWVIKGTVATGEAFNAYEQFNTFFLPQADSPAIGGALSYDFDYSDVEWTFQPTNHPCTSATYEAGTDDISKISTCCITDPTVSTTGVPSGSSTGGGFVANYRPTEAFVEWAGHLTCDSEPFETESGSMDCYKLYASFETWEESDTRCKAAGGKLARIEVQAQQDLVEDILARKFGQFNVQREDFLLHAWIGLTANASGSNVFTWADNGDALDFENWASNTPDDVAQECAAVARNSGKWNDFKCSNRKQFMCQFSPPVWNKNCVEHVIQRPKYTAPTRQARKCWDMYGSEETKDDVSLESDKWALAQAFCEKDGGFLARVEDVDDVLFMGRLLESRGVNEAWIGARRKPPAAFLEFFAKQYFWGANSTTDPEVLGVTEVHGQTGTNPGDPWFDPWKNKGCSEKEGQPFTPDNSKFCVKALGDASGKWCRADCEENKKFVCEYPREADSDMQCDSDDIVNADNTWDEAFPLQYQGFMDVGKFKGMNASPGVVAFDNLDPFFGQFSFEIQLDEVELRSKAGKLRGTVGVEHTVDTFLGISNFRPTGLVVLDTFSTQTNIHLEKTSFFTVSTHGVNEYTFLEYVNMRLVMILNEDADFSGAQDTNGLGDSESTNRTLRTARDDNACYVQVTFTMGAQYAPNLDSGGLVPHDSVRVGRGTFFDTVDGSGAMEHVCSEYDAANASLADPSGEVFGLGAFAGRKDTFLAMVAQACAPQSSMCASPTSVPDQFVSFNIPLGFEVFDGQANSDLSNNVFVEFVVNALDTGATGTPNAGDDPMQMKTTLTASIPIVAGGINIFCDGITAKTDLKDVANVDIVVGSATNATELTRLRIMEDIASTDLESVPSSEINTDSIESALMTLVIKGNESYFSPVGRNTDDYTMELDDVITLHLMEDGQARVNVALGDGKEGKVKELLAEAGDDNSDSNGLDTDGYALNGAFDFTVDRLAGQASLEPSTRLLQQCPFNPPRPVGGNNPLESCILRRDVQLRGYPKRTGAQPTAMEILASTRHPIAADVGAAKDSTELKVNRAAAALGTTSAESAFLAEILGDSAYTRQLAPDFARAIHARYALNGRYRRAYWINPGYEWTPTQTAGKSLFSVSQKIYLFALVSLDENWGARRRRMLLQTSSGASDPVADNDAGMNAASIAFEVTPSSMMAQALGVPEDRVALFSVEMQLTPAEACMSPAALQGALRLGLLDMLTDTASSFLTVQVTSLEIDLADEQCAPGARRNVRSLLAGFSTASATIQMLVVFDKGTDSRFDMAAFAQKAGVTSIEADPRNSPRIDTAAVVDCGKEDCGEKESSAAESSSSSNVALIAGVAGGVGGALVVGVAALLLMRHRKPQEPVMAVETINVSDLKAQLSADM